MAKIRSFKKFERIVERHDKKMIISNFFKWTTVAISTPPPRPPNLPPLPPLHRPYLILEILHLFLLLKVASSLILVLEWETKILISTPLVPMCMHKKLLPSYCFAKGLGF
jgi:hypothetical protein